MNEDKTSKDNTGENNTWETMALSVDGHIATVRLTSLTMAPQFFEDLTDLFGRVLPVTPSLRAVVVQSAHQKAFSYGLDLPKTFQQHGPLLTGANLAGPRTELLGLIRRWQAAITAVADLPVPTIAVVNGWCIGGGLDLISACDIRLATADTRISLRETRLAIVADLGSLQRLPPIIGQGLTREMAFTGKDIDAGRAERMHLVNEVFDDFDAAVAAGHTLAAEIAANPPLTVTGTKKVLDYGQDKSVADGLEYVAAWNSAFLASADLSEAVTAYVNKRPPVYTGE